jgi:hypothetical protein
MARALDLKLAGPSVYGEKPLQAIPGAYAAMSNFVFSLTISKS